MATANPNATDPIPLKDTSLRDRILLVRIPARAPLGGIAWAYKIDDAVPYDQLLAIIASIVVSGPAGGDLSGTYPNPTVDGLQGNPVSAAAPALLDVLTWDGATWVPAPVPAGSVPDGDYGDITVGGGGATWTIDNDVVTYAKMQNVSATDRLLGRSTAGAGDVEEITCTPFARTILDDANASAVRTTIGAGTGSGDMLGSNNLSDVANAATSRTNLGLGTIATQAANSVAITGGAISGITDLAIADGGTGASTAAAARTNLITRFTEKFYGASLNPASNTTYYFGAYFESAPITTANRMYIKIPIACVLREANISIRVSSTLDSAANGHTIVAWINNTTAINLSSTIAANAIQQSTTKTGMSQAIAAGDTIEIRVTTPNPYSTLPTGVRFSVTLYFE